MHAELKAFQGEIKARIRLYHTLTGARRALARMISRAGVLPAREDLLELGQKLAEIGRTRLMDPRPALQDLDAHFARMAKLLRGAANDLSFAQLRSAVADEGASRDEALAVLDVLASGASQPEQIRSVEYLTTWLSSERCGEIRSVTHDPVKLTPNLMALCARQLELSRDDPQAAKILDRLCKAEAELSQQVDGGPVPRDMRSVKDSLGERIFLPELLRQAVLYNVAAWNCHEAHFAAERAQDHLETACLLEGVEFEIDFDEPSAQTPAPAPPVSNPAVPNRVMQARDAEASCRSATATIAAELVRAPGEPSCGSPEAARLAAVLDRGALTERELRAFRSDAQSRLDELIRTTVVTGLLIDRLPGIEPDLERLGADAKYLRTEWVLKLGHELRESSSELVAGTRLDEARALSQVKNRFLMEPLAAVIRDRAEEKRAGREEWAPVNDAADLRDEGEAPSIIFFSDQPRPKRSFRPHAGILAAALALALVWRLAITTGLTFAVFGPDDLGELSRYIAGGYRGRSGESALFIGNVTERWHKLSNKQQQVQGAQISRRLSGQGVREVMLYDDDRNLALHAVRGEIRIPAPEAPDESEAR